MGVRRRLADVRTFSVIAQLIYNSHKWLVGLACFMFLLSGCQQPQTEALPGTESDVSTGVTTGKQPAESQGSSRPVVPVRDEDTEETFGEDQGDHVDTTSATDTSLSTESGTETDLDLRMDPSLARSSIALATDRVASGASVSVTLTLRDADNNLFVSEDAIIAFTFSGGTSTGNFGPVSKLSPGVYQTTFTGVLAGSPIAIAAAINNQPIESPLPMLIVVPGAISSDHSLLRVGSETIVNGATTNLYLEVRDRNNNRILTGGSTVVFGLEKDASNGNIGIVNDDQAGEYFATFTATTVGAPARVFAWINGVQVTTPSPQITVMSAVPMYALNYDANGATQGSVPPSQTIASGSVVTIAGNGDGLLKNQEIFVGWNTAADGSGVWYRPNSNTVVVSNLTLYAQFSIGWTRQLGNTSATTHGEGIATDVAGNILVTGWTTGSLNNNNLQGMPDLFVTKYDHMGTKLWTQQLGVRDAATYSYAIASDSSGFIYVTGQTDGRLSGRTLIGYQDCFVVKYQNDGQRVWTQLLGVSLKNTWCTHVAVDANDSMYVTGATTGSLDGNSLMGSRDFFLTKYDSAGGKKWTRQLGSTSGKSVTGRSVVVDKNGNIYIAGDTDGGLDGNNAIGFNDFFVTKYDNSGVKQWTQQHGVAGVSLIVSGMTADANGHIYVTGATSLDFSGNTQMGDQDLFVAKYDGAGSLIWVRQLGVGNRETVARDITTDAFGNIYVAGETTGGLDGSSPFGSMDFFVTKYNLDGVKQWTRQGGSAYHVASSHKITSDRTGNLIVTGFTDGGLYGSTQLGNLDAFVHKFVPVTFQVIYSANNPSSGAAPIDSQIYFSGSSVTLAYKPSGLAKTGYRFLGWNTKPDGSGTNYTAGTGTLSIINTNVTLYANWVPL